MFKSWLSCASLAHCSCCSDCYIIKEDMEHIYQASGVHFTISLLCCIIAWLQPHEHRMHCVRYDIFIAIEDILSNVERRRIERGEQVKSNQNGVRENNNLSQRIAYYCLLHFISIESPLLFIAISNYFLAQHRKLSCTQWESERAQKASYHLNINKHCNINPCFGARFVVRNS